MAVAAAVAAATVAVLLPKMLPLTGGPIQSGGGGISIGDNSAQTFLGYQADVGIRLGYGENLLKNSGETPVKLSSATLLSETSDQKASIVDVRIRTATDEGSVAIERWPWDTVGGHKASNATTEPLEGYVLPPNGEAWLIFIIDLDEPGRTDWKGARVEYETEGLLGAKHRVEFRRALSLCAPATHKCGQR